MKVANLIGYYAVYWSIVYFENKPDFYFYILIFLLTLLFHFFITAKNFKARELKLILSAGLVGAGFDFLLEYMQVFKLHGHKYFWLPIIWAAFAMTFNYSLSKIFRQKDFILFLLGAIFGPFAYYTAGKFQLLSYSLHIDTILIHALAWGLFMIFFKILREKINENI
jgi:hypothetical protein